MEVVRDIKDFVPASEGAVVTIGVFDGLHRGHRAIIAKAREEADRDGLELVLFSFSPGPREFFSGSDEDYYLLNADEFIEKLTAFDIDRLLLCPFDKALRETSAAQFLHDILLGTLGARTIVVGSDFTFGYEKAGDIDFIRTEAENIGLRLISIDEITDEGMPIRSTVIRELIRDGRIEEANRLLGYYYPMRGKVVKGSGIGRTLGFRTANLEWPLNKVKPKRGVYSMIAGLAGKEYAAVSNIGVRPTVADEGSAETFEVHILDFEDDVMNRELMVKFVSYLREERKFPSKEALAARIGEDVLTAKELYSKYISDEDEVKIWP